MKTQLETRSYQMAKQVVLLCDVMIARRVAYPLVNQFLRASTSIAANLAESRQAQSRADFAAKMAIASKEAQEAMFWLRLLHDTQKITAEEFDQLHQPLIELCKMLAAACKKLSPPRNL